MAVPWARCPSQTQRIRPLVRLFQTQNQLGISKALVDGLNFSVSLTFGALGRLNTSSSYLKLLYNQNFWLESLLDYILNKQNPSVNQLACEF